jgi:lipid A 3-O-deacylase
MRRVLGGLAVLLCTLVLGLPGLAGGAEFDVTKLDHELGLRFSYAKSTRTASVNIYSLLPRWGFSFVRPGQSLGPCGISFVVEGILSVAGAEDTGFEVGVTPLFKFYALLFPSVMVFVEGGAGLISEGINSPAIAHSFNFTPQAGAGVDIALTQQTAFTVAYRFRHSSNAGIYKENPAFNVNMFQAGVSYYY